MTLTDKDIEKVRRALNPDLIEVYNTITKELREFTTNIAGKFDEIKSKINDIETGLGEEINIIKEESKLMQERVKKLEERKNDTEKKLLRELDERQNARDKIVISGITEEKEGKEAAQNIIEKLGLDPNGILWARRMGREQRGSGPRKIMVKLETEDLKQKVMRKKKTLKDEWKNVYIDEALSKGQKEKLNQAYAEVRSKNEAEEEKLGKEQKIWIVAGPRSNPYPKKINRKE